MEVTLVPPCQAVIIASKHGGVFLSLENDRDCADLARLCRILERRDLKCAVPLSLLLKQAEELDQAEERNRELSHWSKPSEN